ncbi:MAG: UPF0182 family protein [Vicinamibacterales bacterium]
MPPPTSAGARLRFAVIVLAGLVLFVLPALVSLAADWLWFDEVGYRGVLTTSLTSQALTWVTAFVAAGAWLVLNLRIAWQSIAEEPASFTTRDGFTVALPGRAQLRPLALIAAAGGAFLVASFASGQWLTLLQWWYQVPFGAPDPVLGRDPAFYVFTLPVLEMLRNLAVASSHWPPSEARRVRDGRPPGAHPVRPPAREPRLDHLLVARRRPVRHAGTLRLARSRAFVMPSGIIQVPATPTCRRMPHALLSRWPRWWVRRCRSRRR